MTQDENLPKAKMNRAEYRAHRASLMMAEKDAPVMHQDNPLLPALTAGGPMYLPYAFSNKPIKILIPTFAEWDAATPTAVQIRVTVDETPDDIQYEYRQITPLDPPPPITMTLHTPAKDATGDRAISYTFRFGGNSADVKSLVYRVDMEAPILDKLVQVPQSIKDQGLGPEDFEGGKTVRVTFDYSNKKLGHVVECFFGPSQIVNKQIGTWTVTETNFNDPIAYELTSEHVQGMEGEHSFFTRAVSYSGVRAIPSEPTKVWVSKDRKPIVVEPLKIPQAPEPADILEIEHLVEGVGARLDKEYENFNKASDNIVFFIDDEEQPAQPISAFPFLGKLDNKALIKQGHGLREVKVGYQIKRGPFLYPSAPIERMVKLDARKPAAPWDPDKPNPPDETLLQPWIQGPVSTERNILTLADKESGRPVAAYLNHHVNLKEGDSCQLYFESHAVPPPGGVWTYPDDGSVDPTKPITFEVLWDFLEIIPDDQNAQLQAVVSQVVNNNLAISPVDYANIRIRPIVLVAAQFKYMDPDEFIGFICSSLRKHDTKGVVGVVQIPPDKRLAGNEVSLRYGGYSNAAADQASLIPGTSGEDKFTPTLEQAEEGFDMYVSYEFLLNTRNAYGRADYAVTIVGETVATKGAVVRVNMSDGSDTCKLPGVIPV